MNGSKTYDQAMLELTTCPRCKGKLEATADVTIRFDRRITIGNLGYIQEQNRPNIGVAEYDFRCKHCNILVYTGVSMRDDDDGQCVAPVCDNCYESVYDDGGAVQRDGRFVFLCAECFHQ